VKSDKKTQEEKQARIDDFLSRKGRFFIGYELIWPNPFEVQKLLSKVLIRAASHSWEKDGIEYSGHSLQFEPVEPGIKGHWYDVVRDESEELQFVRGHLRK